MEDVFCCFPVGDVVPCGWGRSILFFWLLGMNYLRGTAFFLKEIWDIFLGAFDLIVSFLFWGWMIVFLGGYNSTYRDYNPSETHLYGHL